MEVAHVNSSLEKTVDELVDVEVAEIVRGLLNRLRIEFKKNDKSGIYGVTQYDMAYNSNRIEGSRLSKKHTIALFDTGTIHISRETVSFCAKDVEEATGHFLMFNHMLATFDESLTEKLIKKCIIF